MALKILFQGDSITDGGRWKDKEHEWDLNHHMGQGYAFAVSSLLGSKYPEKEYEFVNRGISGNRITDLYARMREDIINIAPDVLSILIGVNDVGREVFESRGTEPEKYERIYRLIIDETKQKLPNTKLVLMEPFSLPVKDVGKVFDRWENHLAPLREIVKKLAEEYGFIFVPLQEKFNDLCKIKEASYWLWDGVHPTPSGHGIIAQSWIEATKDIL